MRARWNFRPASFLSLDKVGAAIDTATDLHEPRMLGLLRRICDADT